MPTLLRLLTVLAILFAIVYALLAALIHFVEPNRAVIEQSVPVEGYGRLARPPQSGAPMLAPPE